jgi:hypothetical protein
MSYISALFATKAVGGFTSDFYEAVIGGIIEVPMVPKLKQINFSPCARHVSEWIGGRTVSVVFNLGTERRW